MTPSHHFLERAGERIGPRVNGRALAKALGAAIRSGGTDRVSFIGRQDKHGLHLWRFQYADGRMFRVVVNPRSDILVTLMSDEDSASG